MSYVRRSESSDVYLFHHVNGYITCCGCTILHSEWPKFYKRSRAIRHLNYHIKLGDKVPQKAFDRLQEEMDEEGDDVV